MRWNDEITLSRGASHKSTGSSVVSLFVTSTQRVVQMTSQARYIRDLRLARKLCCVIDWKAPYIDCGEKSCDINLDP